MAESVLYLTHGYARPNQISTGAATRHFYHVQGLVEKGKRVRVITSDQPTISSTRLEFDKGNQNPAIQTISVPAIGRDGIVPRMAYHACYFAKTILNVWRTPKSDIVIASTPTIFVGWIGYLVSKKHQARFVLDVRDLWADSLATTSLARIPFFLSFNKWLERTLYARADIICCTSQAQVDTVRALARQRIPVVFIPNGIDPEVSTQTPIHPFMQEIRKKYQWVGLFAGKYSRYTDLGNLIDAARELEKDNFALVLLGGGYAKEGLQEKVRIESIGNVFFHGPVPKSQVASFEAGANIFFINYSPEQAWAKVLPNKVFDYMYWNKPIIAAVVPGEITKVLEESGAGKGVPPGNPKALAEAVRSLLAKENSQINSRAFLFAHFDRKKTVQKFVDMIADIN
jgi:glycosyltransferase involved in cell wall biosynthesis